MDQQKVRDLFTPTPCPACGSPGNPIEFWLSTTARGSEVKVRYRCSRGKCTEKIRRYRGMTITRTEWITTAEPEND